MEERRSKNEILDDIYSNFVGLYNTVSEMDQSLNRAGRSKEDKARSNEYLASFKMALEQFKYSRNSDDIGLNLVASYEVTFFNFFVST